MNWLPLALGLALGAGVLLAWQGFTRAIDKDLDQASRHAGMWRLCGGLVLAAGSMIAMTQAGGG